MTGTFVNPLVLTTDLEASTAFYVRVFGLRIVEQTDTIVIFEGGFALHDRNTMLKRIDQPYSAQGIDSVYYFEVDDLDDFWSEHSSTLDVIHPPRVEDWGGRVARFRDPEKQQLEVGEASRQTDNR